MANRVKVNCPQCDKAYRVSPDNLGRTTSCKKCGTKFELEAIAEVVEAQATTDTKEQGEWHVTIGKKSKGSFNTSQIAMMIQKGRVKSDTLVWKEGMEDWQPVSSIPEFCNNFLVMDIPEDSFADNIAAPSA